MPRISLEAVRVNAKKTQKEWAELLRVSNTTVVSWEKGNTEQADKFMTALRGALAATMEDLEGGAA